MTILLPHSIKKPIKHLFPDLPFLPQQFSNLAFKFVSLFNNLQVGRFERSQYKVQTIFHRLLLMSDLQTPQLTNQQIIVVPETSLAMHCPTTITGNNMSQMEDSFKKECRVCLDEAELEGNQLMSTCLCTGSLRYIHKKCLQDWLLKKYEQTQDKTAFRPQNGGVFCEICHSPYLVNFSMRLSWADCPTILAKIKANKCMAAVNLIFVIADIFCLIFSCRYALGDSKYEDFSIKQPKYFLVYVAIMLALVSTLYGIYQFVRVFMMVEAVSIESLQTQRKHVYQVQSSNAEKQEGKKSEIQA